MAKEIHIRKPLAVGNDSIAKGFLAFLFVFFELVLKCLHQRIAQLLRGRFRPKLHVRKQYNDKTDCSEYFD